MILLNRKEIRQVFTMKDAIEANKEAYTLLAQDKCKVPLRTQIPSPAVGGTFLFMPSFSEELGAAGLKIVNIFPGNADKGLSTSPASVLLMDAETGYVTAMMDGTCVTQMRTGAASGLAFELFARKDIDLVVNASYSDMHYPITLDLLNHGFNVLTEKPICKKADQLRELIAAAKKNNRTLVGCVFNHASANAFVISVMCI